MPRRGRSQRAPKPGAPQAPAQAGLPTTLSGPLVLVVFTVALTLRGIHVWALHRTPLASLLLGDAQGYDAWAQRIAMGDWLGQGVFYQAPVYPYFLGLLYALVGRDLMMVRVVQSILGSGACVLIALVARNLFGRRAGIISGLLLAFYSPAIFFDGVMQKTTLDLILLCGLLWLVTLVLDRPTRPRCLGLGIALGGLILTRENALVFVPVLLVWLWMLQPTRHKFLNTAMFLIGLGLTLAPVVARNYVVSGELVLTTAQLGPNLYIGNHEGATGTYMPLRKGRGNVNYEREDATVMAEEAMGGGLTAGEVSRYWSARAFDWVRAHPGDWLQLSARKVLLASNAVEATDTEDLYSYAEWSPLLRICDTVLHFGVLAPLGLLGLWLTRARWRDLWILHALTVAYLLSLLLFYVVARYRFPLVPLLLPFAGVVLADFPGWWIQRGGKERRAFVGVLIAAGLLCNLPLQSTTRMRALTRHNLGEALRQAGRPEEAIVEFRAAVALDPENAGALSNLGALLAAKGRHEEALRMYREALKVDPNSAAAHNNVGQELAASGQVNEAIASFRSSLELDPRGAMAHRNLGTALATTGHTAAAVQEFEQAIRYEPADAASHNNLGILLASTGHLDEGIEHFRTALRLDPGFTEATANLTRAEELAVRSSSPPAGKPSPRP